MTDTTADDSARAVADAAHGSISSARIEGTPALDRAGDTPGSVRAAPPARPARHVHTYRVALRWTGNTGAGTASYRGYSRDHELSAAGKPAIAGSSDHAFLGDTARWNPEELLLAAVAACHELWYLALCATAGIVVTAYEDRPEATMVEEAGGGGRFTAILLRPHVTLADAADEPRALALHHDANARCFVANSLNLPVDHAPSFAARS